MITKTTLKSFVSIVLLCVLSHQSSAQLLLKSDKSWDGGEVSYPIGKAEITSIKLRLEEGKNTKFHCHPVPTFGYILSGQLQVETKDDKTIVMNQGESLLEVMKTTHQGTAINGPVELVVFYAGAKDIPNTIFADDERAKEYCK
jgi:quercetin dioxygenase-like cupin family protein